MRLYAPCFADAMEQVRPFFAGVDPIAVDPQLHPKAARAVGSTVEVGPGDALFLPVGWWHAIDAHDVSITLSFIDFDVNNTFPYVW